MKKSILFITACLLFSIAANATVWTVSNNPLKPAQFDNLQEAADTSIVQDYDTLYVMPSPYNYGSLIVRRPLVIMGAGFNPQNENKLKTELDYILFKSLYDEWNNEIKSSDSTIIIGLKINIIGNNGSFNGEHSKGGTDFITIKRCHISTIYMCADIDPVMGWNISNNLIGTLKTGFNRTGWSDDNSDNTMDCIVTNNIIFGWVSELKSSVLSNNLFISDGDDAFYYVNYCTIKNNIFYFNDLNIDMTSNSNYYNNLSYIGGLTDREYKFSGGTNNTFSNNIENVNPQFVYEDDQKFDLTDDYHLAEGSPALGAGFSGEDLGIFDGPSPYIESGAPSIPQILQMNIVDNALQAGESLQVKVKAAKAQ
jgi:hypothetical protein